MAYSAPVTIGQVLSEIGYPVSYYSRVGRAVGGVTPGIFLCQLLYWTGGKDGKRRGHNPNGWVYKSRSEILEETALTRREQETSRRKLRALGILEEKKAPHPHTFREVLYFRVDMGKLHEVYEAFWAEHTEVEELSPCQHETDLPVGTKRTNKEVRNVPPTTETTITETTTESTLGETETETRNIKEIYWDSEKGWEGDIEALFETFTEAAQDLYGFKDLRDYEPRMLFDFLLGEQHMWWVGKNTSDPQKIFATLVSWFRDRYRAEDTYLLRHDLVFCRLVCSYGVSAIRSEDPKERDKLVTSLKRLDSLLTPEGKRMEAYGEWARQSWQSNGSASRRIGDVLNLRKAETFLSSVT
jgi:hypothetical protein